MLSRMAQQLNEVAQKHSLAVSKEELNISAEVSHCRAVPHEIPGGGAGLNCYRQISITSQEASVGDVQQRH